MGPMTKLPTIVRTSAKSQEVQNFTFSVPPLALPPAQLLSVHYSTVCYPSLLLRGLLHVLHILPSKLTCLLIEGRDASVRVHGIGHRLRF